MRRILPALLGISLILLFGFLLFNRSKNASAAQATHLVISEVQIAGTSSDNDFIEIYNPTGSDISLDGLRLAKRTSGTTSASIVAFASDESVPAHGYYLWCNTSINVSLNCDRNTSATVANNNSVAILNGPLATGTPVDAVTFGSPTDPFGEGASLTAPAASSSVERKANSSSDATSMGPGGADEFSGNGEDTDNNASDFVSRLASQPQNSESAIEPPVGPTPTVEPSVTPTLTPSPSPTPSVEPSPTTAPTSSPTPTLSPTPSVVPSVSPTLSPVPPTPTPKIIARGPIFTCTLNYKPWRFFNKTFFFPFIQCART